VTLRRAFKSEAERTSAEQRAPWALSLSQRVRGAEVDTVSAAAAGQCLRCGPQPRLRAPAVTDGQVDVHDRPSVLQKRLDIERLASREQQPPPHVIRHQHRRGRRPDLAQGTVQQCLRVSTTARLLPARVGISCSSPFPSRLTWSTLPGEEGPVSAPTWGQINHSRPCGHRVTSAYKPKVLKVPRSDRGPSWSCRGPLDLPRL